MAKDPDELYELLDQPPEAALCPVCRAKPELWQFTERGTYSKVVMCSTGSAISEDPKFGNLDDGCLLFMPPRAFYQPTRREALRVWNNYADALVALRAVNAPIDCACFPGCCRGGDVVNGKLASGQRCKACVPASVHGAEPERQAGPVDEGDYDLGLDGRPNSERA